MKSNWSEKSTADKIISILRIILSACALLSAILQLLGVWDEALNVAVPLLSVVILLQSIQEHKKHRAVAIVGYCCFIVMVIMILGAWFLK